MSLFRCEPQRRPHLGPRVAGSVGGSMWSGSHLSTGFWLATKSSWSTSHSSSHRRSAKLSQPLLSSRSLFTLRMRLPARILRKRLQFNGRYILHWFFLLDVNFLNYNLLFSRHSSKNWENWQWRRTVWSSSEWLSENWNFRQWIHWFIAFELPNSTGSLRRVQLATGKLQQPIHPIIGSVYRSRSNYLSLTGDWLESSLRTGRCQRGVALGNSCQQRWCPFQRTD